MKNFLKSSSPKTYRTIEDDFFFLGIIFAVLVTITVFLFPLLQDLIQLPPCWFHLITGYYCPGCGGTRALRALFHGHFLQAVWFHPFVPYTAVVYLYFMVTQTVERISRGRFPIGMRYHNYLVWTAVVLILGNFILKNVLHDLYGFIL